MDGMWMHGTGFLTSEERKMPIAHGCSNAMLESVADLSSGVKIIPYGSSENYTPQDMACDVAQFTMWWSRKLHKRMNGFSGIDCIKWEIQSK